METHYKFKWFVVDLNHNEVLAGFQTLDDAADFLESYPETLSQYLVTTNEPSTQLKPCKEN